MKRFTPFILLAIVCGTLFFWRLGSVPLIGLDEGLYAGCAREMAASGNFIVPTIESEPFFDKPPLCYWLQAACMRFLGVNSYAVRLPSAIAALMLVFLTVFIGGRLFDKRAGLMAGFALTSTLLTTALARMCLLDQAFTLTITAALGSFILSYLNMLPRWGYLVFWAAMGLSVMVKGPAGAVLILIIIAAFLLIRRQGSKFAVTMPLIGVIIFLAIVLPWYVLVQRETGGTFLREFIIHQNLQRAMGQDFHHNMPFYFYLPIFLVGFFPWSIFVPLAWKNYIKLKPYDRSAEASLFLAIWMICVVGIFSMSRSKLQSYILPSFPAAAMLVGLTWSRAIESGKLHSIKRYSLVCAIIAIFMAVAMLEAQSYLPRPIPGLTSALVPMSISLVLGTVLAVILLRMNRALCAFAALCGGMTAFLLIAAGLGLPIAARSEAYPTMKMAIQISKIASPNDHIFSYKLSPGQPALGFYAQRPVYTTKTLEELAHTLASHKNVLIVTQENQLQELPKGGRLLAKVKQFSLYRYSR